MENEWKICFRQLLDYFNAMEGTTYLYGEEEIESFVSTCPENIRAELSGMLREYHLGGNKT